MIRALVALLLIGATSAEIPVEDGVLVLGDDNFADAIKANDLLVEFYAPWCGHCKKLDPEYKKAAAATEGESVKLAKVDATVHTKLAEEFGIKGFPTLKFFRNGKPTDYNGGRTAADIISFVKKQSGPAAKTVSTYEEIVALQENNEVVVVGWFSDATSSSAKGFLSVAGGDESGISFVISSSDAVKAGLEIAGETVVVLKSFDDKRVDLAVPSFDKDSVADFVQKNSVPLVQTFSQESSKRIFASKIQKHALFFTNTEADNQANIVNVFTTVAKQFQGELLVVNVPSTESRVTEYFGVESGDLPKLIVVDMSTKSLKKYPFEGDLSSANAIAGHITTFLAGGLKPTLKTETALPEDTTGDVVVLRGSSFADIVLNNEKDVLVEFYAPWCGHCKKLAPTWDELGAKFKDNANVVIAKMDATANEVDVDGMSVSGFPTIYFFPGQNKRPVKYEAGRELDDFVEYLKEHSSNKGSHSEL